MILDNLLQILAAGTFPRLVRDRVALAIASTTAYILAFEADLLDRLAASALFRISLASFAGTFGAASAKNCRVLVVYCQQVHGHEVLAAGALSGLLSNGVAFAIIIAVADIIDLALVRCNDDPYRCSHKSYDHKNDNAFFHYFTSFQSTLLYQDD
jgi:hypothetical protein